VARAIAAASAAAVALPLLIILLVTASPQAPSTFGLGGGGLGSAVAQAADALGGAPTPTARAGIPATYLAWYMGAASTCPGLPWSVLAGIGTVESDNGESAAPGVRSGANFAGAEGPMQFEPATFAQYAIDADPGRPVSPYDPVDAIYAAAAMLCAHGARGGNPSGIEQAIFAYNHADWYVSDVMSWAAKYAAQGSSRPVATAIAFARAQLGKPYQWGATGPGSYDCSGLVYAAYAAAGIHLARTTYQWQQDGPVIPLTQIQPGDLLFSAGSDGTPTNPGHVVMYLGGGQVIQAPQTGQDVQIDPADLASVIVATRPVGLTTKP
jgi:cell wall-associated NlpC family hydrolase